MACQQTENGNGMNGGRYYDEVISSVVTGVRSISCSRFGWRKGERAMGMNVGSDEGNGVAKVLGKCNTVEFTSFGWRVYIA